MNTATSLLIASGALALLLASGCSSDGYTPKCTPPDYADCLQPATGGYVIPDGSTAPDTAVTPEAAPEAADEPADDVLEAADDAVEAGDDALAE